MTRDSSKQDAGAPAAKPYPGVGQTCLLLLAYQGSMFLVGGLLIAVLLLIRLARGDVPEGLTDDRGFVWTSAVASVAAMGLIILAGKAKANLPWPKIAPLVRFDPKLLAVLLLVGAGLQLLLSEADNVLRMLLPAPAWLMETMREMAGEGLASFVLLVIIAPITEEVLFRGLVWQGYVKRYGAPRTAVYSAAMFAVWHLNPYQMLAAFVIGLVLGWLRHRTGSLWPCIWLHATVNAVSLLGFTLLTGIAGFEDGAGPSLQPWWLNLSGVAFAALGFFLLRHLLERKPHPSSEAV